MVEGLIEENPDRVKILRLTRTNDTNHAAVLESDQLRALWSDPILRYSNILDGLFHDLVVICEGYGDCLFYSAVHNELQKSAGNQQGSRLDIMFTQSGGKDRLANFAGALRGVGVPVSVVADIDVLREMPKLGRLVTSLGGDWDQIQPLAARFQTKVNDMPVESRIDAVQSKINSYLSGLDPQGQLLPEDARQLREYLKPFDGWKRIKEGGKAAIRRGDDAQLFEEIHSLATGFGLHIVPVGELEGFDKNIGGHGSRWAIDAIEKGSHKDTKTGARDFVDSICQIASAAIPPTGPSGARPVN